MDVRFWNYSQAPFVSPLQKPMKIEMHNDMYFQPIKVSVNRARKYEAFNQVYLIEQTQNTIHNIIVPVIWQ